MLNQVQNNSTSFKASIPYTQGKKYCDGLAKLIVERTKFLENTPEADCLEVANEYVKSIKTLKKDKNIKEILIMMTDPIFSPTAIVDGMRWNKWSAERLPKGFIEKHLQNVDSTTRYKYDEAYRVMQEINEIASDTEKARKYIYDRG